MTAEADRFPISFSPRRSSDACSSTPTLSLHSTRRRASSFSRRTRTSEPLAPSRLASSRPSPDRAHSPLVSFLLVQLQACSTLHLHPRDTSSTSHTLDSGLPSSSEIAQLTRSVSRLTEPPSRVPCPLDHHYHHLHQVLLHDPTTDILYPVIPSPPPPGQQPHPAHRAHRRCHCTR